MKICTTLLIIIFMLSGCAVNITADSFIYQDDKVEPSLDLIQINNKITHHATLIDISKISLTTPEGLLLNGVKLLHKNAQVNVIFFGGNGMKISQSASILDQFALLPANVIWFDYRGTGVSEKRSNLSVKDLQNDALNIFDFSKENLPDNLPTAVHGLSMGSLLASYIASERAIDGLILDGAISTVPELIDNLVPAWSTVFSTVTVSPELAAIDNIKLIRKYTNPLLFLIGKNDSTTPVEFSQALYDASNSKDKTLTIIADTEHSQTMKREQAIKAYATFIKGLTCCEDG
ncbi:alpha/beta hydrolase [Colwellia sp. TT2012]|uniref:alpha/beta hydrolase n=1 Tax=Colwellia sp. TT2012 TaxID=1720342 RepID=UPI000A53B8AE|nr:alpha/beta fold hydrolase [Colwellia sp. TT2012]